MLVTQELDPDFDSESPADYALLVGGREFALTHGMIRVRLGRGSGCIARMSSHHDAASHESRDALPTAAGLRPGAGVRNIMIHGGLGPGILPVSSPLKPA